MSGTSDTSCTLSEPGYLPGKSALVAMAEFIFAFNSPGSLPMTVYQKLLISLQGKLLSTIALLRNFLTAYALE